MHIIVLLLRQIKMKTVCIIHSCLCGFEIDTYRMLYRVISKYPAEKYMYEAC